VAEERRGRVRRMEWDAEGMIWGSGVATSSPVSRRRTPPPREEKREEIEKDERENKK